ncbi:MAG: VOC family protein [Candidatus Acidiferrales bacterium]
MAKRNTRFRAPVVLLVCSLFLFAAFVARSGTQSASTQNSRLLYEPVHQPSECAEAQKVKPAPLQALSTQYLWRVDLHSMGFPLDDRRAQWVPRLESNVKTSCDFYSSKLGFMVESIYGDPPYYGQVVRDNARLNLRLVFEPVFVADVRKREHLLSASITVATANEIKQLFLSYQAAGVSFHQALKKEPWGARTFIVSDPDENLILFARPAAD